MFISLKEAAARLGIGTTTIYRLAGRGELTFQKIGGRTVVSEEELARFISSRPAATIRTR